MSNNKMRWGGLYKRRCGAKTRRGTKCMRRELFKNGRCRNHAGLSTGPKTPEGKRRSLEAMREGHQRWRAEQRRLKAIRKPPRN
jgi:hypothetical protein